MTRHLASSYSAWASSAGSSSTPAPTSISSSSTTRDEGASELSLHEHWTRVVRRAVETLETPTADGLVWRVDLRLRPEGSQGAIVNSVDATERYYATWGRLWERAALVASATVGRGRSRSAPLLEREVIQPFVYRREVDPTLACGAGRARGALARDELSTDPARDLKLGAGRDPRGGVLRAERCSSFGAGASRACAPRTRCMALARLRSRGLVSDGEAQRHRRRLRRCFAALEHRVQWMTGLQTHLLPRDDAELGRLARMLAPARWRRLLAVVGTRTGSDSRAVRGARCRRTRLAAPSRYEPLASAVRRRNGRAFADAAEQRFRQR